MHVFEKNPEAILDFAYSHYRNCTPLTEQEEEDVNKYFPLLKGIPEATVFGKVNAFLDTDIFNSDWSVLSNTPVFKLVMEFVL